MGRMREGVGEEREESGQAEGGREWMGGGGGG